MNWYLAIRRMQEPPASWKDQLGAHLAWLHAQHDNGTVIMSGPSTDRSLGIYLMRAHDPQEAAQTARSDPLLASPGATVEIIEWQLHQILGVGSFDPDASRQPGTR